MSEPRPEADPADRARALALIDVSRETLQRLEIFVGLLLIWQTRTNLIAASTIPQIWTRHVADSLQLLPLAPKAKTWVDFGSGGGFPGLVLACALAEKKGAHVHLVESIGKKARFLEEVSRVLGLPATVHTTRIENFGDSFGDKPDVVTARAVASLKVLCGYVLPLMGPKTTALFHKGQDVEAELTEAARYWNIDAELVTSKTSPEGRIVAVRSLKPRKAARKT
ncbi:MAG TPA: 16S rRNA (guanine(527)-N(7))-methyltransferase RsmG [Pseudolabrys sp.]|nr:16S rRNA (guanine(527)-N(7))-methyltransferase RsmG [Pseudolabrys sp.]